MRIPLAREGYPFVGAPAAAAVALWIGGFLWTGLAAAVAAAACAVFFRDPDRRPPSDPEAIVSAADGKVLSVEKEGEGARISVFLSILDVHVNRAPVSGRVRAVTRTPGRFLAAFDARAARLNEQVAVTLDSDRGPVVVRQIAGVIARRIVCRAREGDRLATGERFGLIRFGSRTDVILPPGASPLARPGDRVRGGCTVVARWDLPGLRGRQT
jgi:phosphatidylserine decarboxylase